MADWISQFLWDKGINSWILIVIIFLRKISRRVRKVKTQMVPNSTY